MTTSVKNQFKEIYKIFENYNNNVCVECGKDFNKCGHYYDLANAYIEQLEECMKKIIEGIKDD